METLIGLLVVAFCVCMTAGAFLFAVVMLRDAIRVIKDMF